MSISTVAILCLAAALCALVARHVIARRFVIWRDQAQHSSPQPRSTTLSPSPNERHAVQASDFAHMACESASDGLVVQDMGGLILWANPAYCNLHGYSLNELVGQNPLSFALSPSDTPPPEVIKNFRYDPNDSENNRLQLFRNMRRDGTLFWNQLSVSFRQSAQGEQTAILVCRDVSEQVEQAEKLHEIQKRLQHEASHDNLTGVPNRSAMMAFITENLARPGPGALGLFHIDLDNFKDINDTLGHGAGDTMLRCVAQRLVSTARAGDLVARIGGDEFLIASPNVDALDDLRDIGAALLQKISAPIDWSNGSMQTTASIGAALASPDIAQAEDILLHSDFALYEAKRNGRARLALYDETLHVRHSQHLQRAGELCEDIDAGRMEYMFQPTLDLRTGRIAGVETLVRWRHDRDGLIPPDNFLPFARELGLMDALDLQSMNTALKQSRALIDAGYPDLDVAFNASPELLAHPDFLDHLAWGVEALQLDRSKICVELLESIHFGDHSESKGLNKMIQDLRAAGFKVMLDDFGIGYAGLTHLANLNVTGVKIDRGLVTNMLQDQVSQKIVRKIIELSNDLGLVTIAEGIEDIATADALRAMGCQIIQGYWLSKPLLADDLHGWLENRSTHPAQIRA